MILQIKPCISTMHLELVIILIALRFQHLSVAGLLTVLSASHNATTFKPKLNPCMRVRWIILQNLSASRLYGGHVVNLRLNVKFSVNLRFFCTTSRLDLRFLRFLCRLRFCCILRMNDDQFLRFLRITINDCAFFATHYGIKVDRNGGG